MQMSHTFPQRVLEATVDVFNESVECLDNVGDNVLINKNYMMITIQRGRAAVSLHLLPNGHHDLTFTEERDLVIETTLEALCSALALCWVDRHFSGAAARNAAAELQERF